MGDSNAPLFIGIVGFWLLLIIFGNVLGTSLTNADYSDIETSQSSNFFDNFTLIFRIMTFQVYGVPAFISILLDSFAIFSVFIVINILR